MSKVSKGRIRILFIHHGKVLGGAPVSLLNMILGLKGLKSPVFQIKVLCAHREMQQFFAENASVETDKIFNPCMILGRVLVGLASVLNFRTFRIACLELLMFPLSVFMQYLRIKKEAPDIVHLNSSILFSSALAAKMAGVPVVWHIREVLIGGNLNLKKRLAGWFIRSFADKVVAISPYEAKQLGYDSEGKVNVIYNFIDFSHFNPVRFKQWEEKERLGFRENEKLIISLGGISFRKGSVELMESMKSQSSDVKLAFAGHPLSFVKRSMLQKNFISLILRLEDFLIKTGFKRVYQWYYNDRALCALGKLENGRIKFLGNLKDVAGLLAACDVLVFAGTTPHFPRPIFEAWAMKKPVVAFDMDGITQNIDNGKDGVIVKERSGKALSEAIQALLSSNEKMQCMSEAGYVKSFQKFRKEKNVLEFADLYKKIVSKRGSPNYGIG